MSRQQPGQRISDILVPDALAQAQQERMIREQNIQSLAASIYQSLAVEDFKNSVEVLKQEQARWAILSEENRGDRPQRLQLNPTPLPSIAFAYAAHFLDFIEKSQAEARQHFQDASR